MKSKAATIKALHIDSKTALLLRRRFAFLESEPLLNFWRSRSSANPHIEKETFHGRHFNKCKHNNLGVKRKQFSQGGVGKQYVSYAYISSLNMAGAFSSKYIQQYMNTQRGFYIQTYSNIFMAHILISFAKFRSLSGI